MDEHISKLTETSPSHLTVVRCSPRISLNDYWLSSRCQNESDGSVRDISHHNVMTKWNFSPNHVAFKKATDHNKLFLLYEETVDGSSFFLLINVIMDLVSTMLSVFT